MILLQHIHIHLLLQQTVLMVVEVEAGVVIKRKSTVISILIVLVDGHLQAGAMTKLRLFTLLVVRQNLTGGLFSEPQRGNSLLQEENCSPLHH
jgi:hypothetical protein